MEILYTHVVFSANSQSGDSLNTADSLSEVLSGILVGNYE